MTFQFDYLSNLCWFFVHAIAFTFLLVLTQDIHIFPGALFSLLRGRIRDPKTLPRGVESVFVTTEDGKSLEVWRLPADPLESSRFPYCAIIFHGNGASLENFFAVQLWFSSLGITSYSFDYRGFGKSSGWPSEKGINRDSDAVWQYVAERESLPANRLIVFGMSVGGAPAARIASIHQPKVLILVSTFTDLKQVVREQFLVGFLAPFVWYAMRTIDYVRELGQTHLILAHGEKDRLIRPYHSEKLLEAYKGSDVPARITTLVPGHNSTFFAVRNQLGGKLMERL